MKKIAFVLFLLLAANAWAQPYGRGVANVTDTTNGVVVNKDLYVRNGIYEPAYYHIGFVEHFLVARENSNTDLGDLGWWTNGTTGKGYTTSSYSQRAYGVVYIKTSGVAGDYSRLLAQNFTALFLAQGDSMILEMRLSIVESDSNKIEFGYGDYWYDGDNTDGMYFRVLTDSGSVLLTVTSSSGVRTVKNTGVALPSGYNWYKIVSSAVSTNSSEWYCDFYLNDVKIARHTTNLPFGGNLFSVYNGVVKAYTTQIPYLYHDVIKFDLWTNISP